MDINTVLHNFKELSIVSNQNLLDILLYLQNNYEYCYTMELRKLEKQKRIAIIKDLKKFEIVNNQYYQIKSKTPKSWFENWDVYKTILSEAESRRILIKKSASSLHKAL